MARDRGRGRKIDNTHWIAALSSFGAIAAGTSALTAFAAQHLPETLLRLRGELLAGFDGVPDVGDEIVVGAGLILVPEGTGSTVLWSPLADSDAPWIWIELMQFIFEETTANTDPIQAGLSVRRVIDNKSMRRIRNQEVQVVVENITVGTAQAMNVAVNVRGLFGT